MRFSLAIAAFMAWTTSGIALAVPPPSVLDDSARALPLARSAALARPAPDASALPKALPPDVRATMTFDAMVMNVNVGRVDATVSEVLLDDEGREVRTLVVAATGSPSFDAFLKVRATLESTVDAHTLEPLRSRYTAVRGERSWAATFGFEGARVRIDTHYKKRHWRRFRWVEGSGVLQDPLSWMLHLIAYPVKPAQTRTMAVVTRKQYLRMNVVGRGHKRVRTGEGTLPAVESYATFERWYPDAQLGHAKGPRPRKKKVMEARVFWARGGELALPLRMEMRLTKIGAVRLYLSKRTVTHVPDHAQMLESARERSRRAAHAVHPGPADARRR